MLKKRLRVLACNKGKIDIGLPDQMTFYATTFRKKCQMIQETLSVELILESAVMNDAILIY